MNRDLVCGVIGCALAAGYYAMATAIPESMLADTVGPQGLPKSYGIALGLLSFVLVVQSLVKARAARRAAPVPAAPVLAAPVLATASPAAPTEKAPGEGFRARRAAGILAIGAGYVLLVPWLGYPLAVAGLLVATAWHEGIRPGWRMAGIAAIGAACFWLIFVQVLGIQQPASGLLSVLS